MRSDHAPHPTTPEGWGRLRDGRDAGRRKKEGTKWTAQEKEGLGGPVPGGRLRGGDSRLQPGQCALHGCFSPTGYPCRGAARAVGRPSPRRLRAAPLSLARRGDFLLAWMGHGETLPPPPLRGHPPIRGEGAAPLWCNSLCLADPHRPRPAQTAPPLSRPLCLLFRPPSVSLGLLFRPLLAPSFCRSLRLCVSAVIPVSPIPMRLGIAAVLGCRRGRSRV